MTSQSSKFKLQVFMMAFGFNVLLYLMLLALLIFSPSDFYILPVVLVVLGTIGRALSNKRKYISGLTVLGGEVSIEYYTGLLKMKTEVFELNGFEDAEILKRNWFIGYLAALTIKVQGQWLTFHIIERKVLEEVHQKLQLINTGHLKTS